MIWNVREERLLIISDIHLGNCFFKSNRSLFNFLEYVSQERFSLCINGDGLDILQTSLVKMTKELSTAFDYLGKLIRGDTRVYYVIGNHDIILEHFIDDFRYIQLVPFLNVTSGDKRIRVEHGHLYDPFFVKHPDLYFSITRLFGFFLKIHPAFYHVHTFGKRAKSAVIRTLRSRGKNTREGSDEPRHFRQAATELTRRGFDAVVFGHTHYHGEFTLKGGGSYYNAGSWLQQPHCVKIDRGDIQLLPWNG